MSIDDYPDRSDRELPDRSGQDHNGFDKEMGFRPRPNSVMDLDAQERNDETRSTTELGTRPKDKNQACTSCGSCTKSQRSTVVAMNEVIVPVSHPELLESLQPLSEQVPRALPDYGLESDYSMEEFVP